MIVLDRIRLMTQRTSEAKKLRFFVSKQASLNEYYTACPVFLWKTGVCPLYTPGNAISCTIRSVSSVGGISSFRAVAVFLRSRTVGERRAGEDYFIDCPCGGGSPCMDRSIPQRITAPSCP